MNDKKIKPGRPNKVLTNREMSLLKDPMRSAKQLSGELNVSEVTIKRWRKKYGINVPLGSKKGKSKPERKNGSYQSCKICNKKFYRPLSSKQIYCSRNCMYECEEYIEKLKNIDKSYMQTEEYKDKHRKDNMSEYGRYAGQVHRLSNKVYKENIDKINPNGYPRTVAGVEGGYQLDHIISVRYGFDNNIPIEVMCEVSNLRMLSWRENLARNKKN